MDREPIILNKRLHELLKLSGYEFLLITDVQFNGEMKVSSITVEAIKKMPGGMVHSCTGIDDPMITTFIDGETGCSVFIKVFEELPLYLP